MSNMLQNSPIALKTTGKNKKNKKYAIKNFIDASTLQIRRVRSSAGHSAFVVITSLNTSLTKC
jgi:hypothetical protein